MGRLASAPRSEWTNATLRTRHGVRRRRDFDRLPDLLRSNALGWIPLVVVADCGPADGRRRTAVGEGVGRALVRARRDDRRFRHRPPALVALRSQFKPDAVCRTRGLDHLSTDSLQP